MAAVTICMHRFLFPSSTSVTSHVQPHVQGALASFRTNLWAASCPVLVCVTCVPSLLSSGHLPLPARLTLLDSPLGLKQEGWTPARSLHGLEQGAQERPRGLSILCWVGAAVFLLWYRAIQEGRWVRALGIYEK